MIRAIFFDLDGTLIDSEKLAVRAVRETYGAWGVSLPESILSQIVGLKWKDCLKFLFKEYPVALGEMAAEEEIKRRYQEILHYGPEEVPGARRAVEVLSKDFLIGLVSSSDRRDINWALDHLGIREYFKIVLSAEDLLRGKPSPDGYLMAMRALGVSASESIVFEDSTYGIAAGRRAGALVVAVTATNYFKQDQSEAQLKIIDFTNINTKWIREQTPIA